MPEVLVTNLANFLENIDKENLYQSNVKPISAGKRSKKSTKLLDALETKDVYIEKEEDRLQEFIDFTIESIENLEGDNNGC